MFYVYVLKSKINGRLYTGCTEDLRRRFIEHNENKSISTKYRGPYELVYYKAYKAKTDAFHREENLKLRSNAMTGLKRRLKDSLGKAI